MPSTAASTLLMRAVPSMSTAWRTRLTGHPRFPMVARSPLPVNTTITRRTASTKCSQHEVIEAYILSFEAAAPPETQDATVADAIAAAKDAVLKVGPAVVVASSSVGFLMEQDGAMIYVYGGEAAVGDNVTVEATRGEYQGVPQLTSPKVTVNSTGAAITYPTAKDITSTFSAYSSDSREFVTFKGKLNISGNYYNVEVAGSTTVTGSIVKPVEDISSLSGKEVTITGYYLYHTSQGKYLYVIPTKINDIAINGAGGGGHPSKGRGRRVLPTRR